MNVIVCFYEMENYTVEATCSRDHPMETVWALVGLLVMTVVAAVVDRVRRARAELGARNPPRGETI